MSMKDFVDTLTDEQKKALMEALVGKSDQPESTIKNNINEDFTMTRIDSAKNRRETVKGGKNTWTDNGEDRHIITPEMPLTPRNRKPPKKRDVKCSVCGKNQQVNSSLVYGEYYRCNNCIG